MTKFIQICLILTTSCVSNYKSKAPVWLHEPITAELCTPEMFKFGLYRVISCEANPSAKECQTTPPSQSYEEFVPYCDPQVKKYLGILAEDVPELLP